MKFDSNGPYSINSHRVFWLWYLAPLVIYRTSRNIVPFGVHDGLYDANIVLVSFYYTFFYLLDVPSLENIGTILRLWALTTQV